MEGVSEGAVVRLGVALEVEVEVGGMIEPVGLGAKVEEDVELGTSEGELEGLALPEMIAEGEAVSVAVGNGVGVIEGAGLVPWVGVGVSIGGAVTDCTGVGLAKEGVSDGTGEAASVDPVIGVLVGAF